MQKTIELLKTAIEAEVRSQAFYAKAAELTNDDESRMVFIELADMEEGHAQHLADRFNKGEIARHGDLQSFLDQLGEGEDLIDVEITPFVKDAPIHKVLEFAIRQEEKARDNYLALAERLTDEEDVAYCQTLVTEEEEHAARLQQLLLSLDMDEAERPGM